MKRFNAIVATFGVVAHAISLEAKLEAKIKAMTEASLQTKSGQHYTIVSSEPFAHQVETFNDEVPVFSQSAYELRLHTEAELLIALETLKEYTIGLLSELKDLQLAISSLGLHVDTEQYAMIMLNQDELAKQYYTISQTKIVVADACSSTQ